MNTVVCLTRSLHHKKPASSILALYALDYAYTRKRENKSKPLTSTGVVEMTSSCFHIRDGSSGLLRLCKPLCFLPLKDSEETFPRSVVIERRENVFDDVQIGLVFSSDDLAQEFIEKLDQISADVPRNISTKVYLATSHNDAQLLDETPPSHSSLVGLINTVLSEIAYGTGGSVLAPVIDWPWNLENPITVNAIEQVKALFNDHLPPVVIICDYEEGIDLSSMALSNDSYSRLENGLMFPHVVSESSNPLKPNGVCDPRMPLREAALHDFGFHARYGSQTFISPKRIYLNPSLANLYVDVFDFATQNPDSLEARHSLHAITAAVKIIVVHELAHHVVSCKSKHGDSPTRSETLGANRPIFDDCIDERGGDEVLESGLVVEKLWLGKRYGLAYDAQSVDSIVLFYREPSAVPADANTLALTRSSQKSPQPILSPRAHAHFIRTSCLSDEEDDSGESQGDEKNQEGKVQGDFSESQGRSAIQGRDSSSAQWMEEAEINHGWTPVWIEHPSVAIQLFDHALPVTVAAPPTPDASRRRTIKLRSMPKLRTPPKASSKGPFKKQFSLPPTPSTPAPLRRALIPTSALKIRSNCVKRNIA